MIIAKNISESRAEIAAARKEGRKISLVPTMGALHNGHLSLLKIAKRNNEFCVMSLFVNKIQFNDKSDFDKYPRDYGRDAALAEKTGCDLLFMPDDEVMYHNQLTYVSPEYLDEYLCGATRPGHFRGVCTVVTKLFNIIQPDIAIFGQKDIQQVSIISKMVADLNFHVKIIIAPIIREDSGLAMSSRNSRLSDDERKRSISISKSLKLAELIIKTSEKDSDIIIDRVKKDLETEGKPDSIDYISIVDFDTLHPVKKLGSKNILAIAAFFGQTRLIDNMIIDISGDSVTCTY